MTSSKVAVVTGANKGLGLEIARQLAQAGVVVYAAAREPQKAEAAAEALRSDGDVRPLTLDVTKASDIEAALQKVQTETGRLDILINNAGIAVGSAADVRVEQLRTAFETNVFAPFALTTAFLPLLKASPDARVVNHSSILGSLTSVSSGAIGAEWLNAAYCASKTALNMLSAVAAQQLKSTNVKVFAAHPGWVQTDMGGQEAPLKVQEGAKTAVDLALGRDESPTGSFRHLGKTLPW